MNKTIFIFALLLSSTALSAVTVVSITYRGTKEIVTYSDGHTATFAPVGKAVVAWKSDHVTRTSTYAFADKTTTSVVDTVAGKPGKPTYNGSVETIVTTYGDGYKASATYQGTPSVTWGKDHVTRTTTYVFADQTINKIVAKIPGTPGTPSYNGGTETIITVYGDGYSGTATYQGRSSVTWASDHVTKTVTYSFADRTSNRVVVTVPGTRGIPTYSAGTETVITTYGDGYKAKATYSGTASVTWASDHVSKTTTYSFTDGTSNKVTAVVPGTKSRPAYSGGTETIITTYGDGFTSAATFQGKATVSWGKDHITKTTVYAFADKTTNKVVETIPGTYGTAVYDGTKKTLPITYADGTRTTIILIGKPTSTLWGSDHTTKTTTYVFDDGTKNDVVETVAPVLSTATVIAAVYPTDWASGLSMQAVTAPSTGSIVATYGDGTQQVIADGSAAKPFSQASLTPNGARGAKAINDPNAEVSAPSQTVYDLHWGTPDPAGPSLVNAWFGTNGTATSYTFPSAITIAGHTVSGQGSMASGMTLSVPSSEVKSAWSQGWTGKGQNVLMVDGYPDPINKPAWMSQADYVAAYTHGITTYLLANRYAPDANFYLVDGDGLYDYKVHIPLTNAVPVLQANTHGNLANSVRSAPGAYLDVVNISMGYNYWADNITNPTQAQVDAVFSKQAYWTDYISGVFAGTYSTNYGSSGSAAVYLTDAVVTKAAGNDAITVGKDPLSYTLAYHPLISSRLLLVGALDTIGAASTKGGAGTATLASYSNTAGSDPIIQSRFLVESGFTPYNKKDIAIDGAKVSPGEGTSYAAPRVTGYAAIVRQKFPNLTGANTADILLSTARYDTLSCYPNCDKKIYGQGEASLSRALAPVGYLR